MRIACGSDFHIDRLFDADLTPKERFAALDAFVGRAFQGEAEALLLAGDFKTDILAPSPELEHFFALVTARFPKVFAVLGNHDASFFTDEKTAARKCEALYPGVTFLADESAPLGRFRLYGGTFWPGLSEEELKPVARFFDETKEADLKTCAAAMKLAQKHAAEGLKKELAAHPDSPFVVLTHFPPSFASYHLPERANIGAFCLDLVPFIERTPQIALWVHGHTHTERDYRIGDTRIFCNAHGLPTSLIRRQKGPWSLSILEVEK
jgi:DNA repair exonuclease SbcCD nuclease subunit